jgi:hypothetical protein
MMNFWTDYEYKGIEKPLSDEAVRIIACCQAGTHTIDPMTREFVTIEEFKAREEAYDKLHPPVPGSPAARKKGCTCPDWDNSHGRGIYVPKEEWEITAGCPLHAPVAEAERPE